MTFAEFMRANRGKTVEQAYREYGIDLSQVLSLLGK